MECVSSKHPAIDGNVGGSCPEVLTPDSSRFWPKGGYAVGKSQPSFDKQFVRDYLEGLVWNKTAPAPELPKEIVEKTREKYLEVLRIITGKQDLG